MKKQMFAALATMMAFSAAHAAPSARAVSPEVLSKGLNDYEAVVKKYVLGANKVDATGMAPHAQKLVEEKIGSQLELRSDEIVNLRSVMASSDAKSAAVVERRLDQLITLVAARKITKTMKDNGKTDENIESMFSASQAMTKTIMNSVFTRSKAKSATLKAEELADASLALDKLESLPSQVLKMEQGERDNYASVELKRSELLESGKFSGEEALVEAIMQVRKVDKDEAMKIVRRMKDCV